MGDGRLRWRPQGDTRGTAVLLHGMMSLCATWWRIGPAMASDGWDVTAVDMAGHGGAPRVGGPLTVDALVGRLTSAVPGPVDLLAGHSLGAVTAITAADRDPGLARAVVLEDPPAGRRVDPLVLAEGIESDSALAREDRDRLVRRSRTTNPMWADRDVEEDVRGIEAADVPAITAGLRGGLRSSDVPALVARVTAAGVPVLVLAAAESGGTFGTAPGSALTDDARRGVREALPAGRFVELPGGHCLHRDHPDLWLSAVAAFADEVLPPG
ncbi:MAG TPA: alpha/beta hydrolase [Mycobacteriales bacterium]